MSYLLCLANTVQKQSLYLSHREKKTQEKEREGRGGLDVQIQVTEKRSSFFMYLALFHRCVNMLTIKLHSNYSTSIGKMHEYWKMLQTL
jgi:hypothetical protein